MKPQRVTTPHMHSWGESRLLLGESGATMARHAAGLQELACNGDLVEATQLQEAGRALVRDAMAAKRRLDQGARALLRERAGRDGETADSSSTGGNHR